MTAPTVEFCAACHHSWHAHDDGNNDDEACRLSDCECRAFEPGPPAMRCPPPMIGLDGYRVPCRAPGCDGRAVSGVLCGRHVSQPAEEFAAPPTYHDGYEQGRFDEAMTRQLSPDEVCSRLADALHKLHREDAPRVPGRRCAICLTDADGLVPTVLELIAESHR